MNAWTRGEAVLRTLRRLYDARLRDDGVAPDTAYVGHSEYHDLRSLPQRYGVILEGPDRESVLGMQLRRVNETEHMEVVRTLGRVGKPL